MTVLIPMELGLVDVCLIPLPLGLVAVGLVPQASYRRLILRWCESGI
jgi:hypothetical protein